MKKPALLILMLLCTFAGAMPQEKDPNDPASIIESARDALQKVHQVDRELNYLSETPMMIESREKLEQHMQGLRTKRKALFSIVSRASELAKIDTPILSYPGLVALGPIQFNLAEKSYTLLVLVGYSSYELGPAAHPIHRKIKFDLDGKITEIKLFDSSRAWEH